MIRLLCLVAVLSVVGCVGKIKTYNIDGVDATIGYVRRVNWWSLETGKPMFKIYLYHEGTWYVVFEGIDWDAETRQRQSMPHGWRQ